MTHRLTTNCAKNYCNRTIIVKDIVENVVTCFLGGHGVDCYCKVSVHPFVVWLPSTIFVRLIDNNWASPAPLGLC